MKIGLHVSNFTWPGGPATLASDLGRVAVRRRSRDSAKLSVMDHVWQITGHRSARARHARGLHDPRIPGGRTDRIELLAWVTAVVYREPGLLAKVGNNP